MLKRGFVMVCDRQNVAVRESDVNKDGVCCLYLYLFVNDECKSAGDAHPTLKRRDHRRSFSKHVQGTD